ncbi:MAG: efflux RND transporter permease subunit, partial [Planctomycetes bacterium]|nr:efflux RND transporter permease subunit [Planctomycetota bacterium]
QYPHISSTLITVSTAYPGASPATVQGFITSRLEQAIAQAPNIDYMTANSTEGVSTIQVYMQLNSDPNADVAQILAKVKQVASQLPPASQTPVINETVGNPRALMYLAFYSKTMNQQQINDYLLRVVQPQMQAIPGVAQAQILPPGAGSSGNSFALRAWLNPRRLAGYGLTPADVANALAANDYISAVGRVRGKNIAQVVSATTSLHNLAEFRNLVIKPDVQGVPIYLKDVARVELGAQNYNSAVFLNGIPAVFVGIQTTPDANSLNVAHAAHQVFAAIMKKLPPGLKARIAYDASVYINSAIHEVLTTIAITLGVVILVVFLFLGSLRSLLIPMVAIPLSTIGAGIFMLAGGFTINLLTLLAIILAIGLVVDDAIIMVENIHRHIDEGLAPLQAAFRGARELAAPIIVMSTTLVAVFAPIGFLGGLTGSLFSEFAFTLIFTVLISMIVA